MPKPTEWEFLNLFKINVSSLFSWLEIIIVNFSVFNMHQYCAQALHILSYLIPTRTFESIIVPSVQMRRSKLREIKEQSQVWNLFCLQSDLVIFVYCFSVIQAMVVWYSSLLIRRQSGWKKLMKILKNWIISVTFSAISPTHEKNICTQPLTHTKQVHKLFTLISYFNGTIQ